MNICGYVYLFKVMTSSLPCRRCIALIIITPIAICLLLHYSASLRKKKMAIQKNMNATVELSAATTEKKTETKSMPRCASDVSVAHICRHSVCNFVGRISFYLFDIVPLAFGRVQIRTNESISIAREFRLNNLQLLHLSMQWHYWKKKTNLSCESVCEIYLLQIWKI